MLSNSVQPRAIGFRNPTVNRRILVIEDNDADANLIRMVHDDKLPWSSMDVVNTAAEAIQYLCGGGKFTHPGAPDLVVMDMFVPLTSDLELIGEIRALPGCELTPIVVISGSDSPWKMREAYRLGANCVVHKSSRLEEYFRRLARCLEFWCGIAELPRL